MTSRVLASNVLAALGVPAIAAIKTIANGEVVFAPTELLNPALKRLLDVRRVVGLRNPGHTVAKLLDPCRGEAADGGVAPALRVVNYTHPEYGRVLREFASATRANLMLMRGTEGEPVADPRRLPQLDVFIDGVARPDLSRPAQSGVLTGLPVLPRSYDASTTALYIQSVISGEKPAPAPLLQQVEALLAALDALPPRTAAELPEQRTA